MCLRLIMLCLVALVSACDGSNPPSGLFTGVWSGTATENIRGQGTMRLTIDHKGAAIDGTLRTVFQGVIDREGPVAGTASADVATITFVPSQPFNCGASGILTGTVSFALTLSGRRLSGSYTQFTCNGVVTAAVDLQRE